MAIDYWKLTGDFGLGDLVQKILPTWAQVSPYVGRVTAVMPGIGFVDVQWPFGNERVSPEELVIVNPELATHFPPSLNSTYYPGHDTRTATQKTFWRTALELPGDFHRELARLFHRGASEVQAYDVLWHRYRTASDESLRDEVSKFYRVASNLSTALLTTKIRRLDASYWAAQDRKYRATREELTGKAVSCPKCKHAPMRKATYKMEGGEKRRLFACPKCMHLVKQTDFLGPDGEPVEW